MTKEEGEEVTEQPPPLDYDTPKPPRWWDGYPWKTLLVVAVLMIALWIFMSAFIYWRASRYQ